VRDFSGRNVLLTYRFGNRRRVLVDLLHALGNAANGSDCHGRGFLHCDELASDLFGGLCGLHCKRFDLGGNHGEAFASLAGTRCFDRRIERKQIGLAGGCRGSVWPEWFSLG